MLLTNPYQDLGDQFYKTETPTEVIEPELFLFNLSLAEQLQIDKNLIHNKAELAKYFSGNQIFEGSSPIATAYAGHQFGNFSPQLGDGRAHLLGQTIDINGQSWELQLKGSGRTFYSRGGDGRCALGPAVREFIMSQAMMALGVPSTQCLAVVKTGEAVFRQSALQGAVVTRVASSHLRVGTFQYFAARGDFESVKTLCEYAINRHYPDITETIAVTGKERYIALIANLIEKQIDLVVHWMRVGFIHGVMNTDNSTISGETIDYGPCAMMSVYDPETVYSSIDRNARYAFGNQAKISEWNITRFIECLLPLIDENVDKAIPLVEPMVKNFQNQFQQKYLAMMGKKFGISKLNDTDASFINSFLENLTRNQLDYTITFDLLTKSVTNSEIATKLKTDLGQNYDLWQTRIVGIIGNSENTKETIFKLMRSQNPVVIPRNHHIENIIFQCENTGQATLATNFLKVLQSPYKETDLTLNYQDAPSDGDRYYQTFCGT